MCTVALAADLIDVTRLTRMLALAAPPPPPPPPTAAPATRFLRPVTDYALAAPGEDQR